MKNTTRAKFYAMVSQIALLNGIDPATAGTAKFTVEPSVQQKLEQRVQEIQRIPVEDQHRTGG